MELSTRIGFTNVIDRTLTKSVLIWVTTLFANGMFACLYACKPSVTYCQKTCSNDLDLIWSGLGLASSMNFSRRISCLSSITYRRNNSRFTPVIFRIQLIHIRLLAWPDIIVMHAMLAT